MEKEATFPSEKQVKIPTFFFQTPKLELHYVQQNCFQGHRVFKKPMKTDSSVDLHFVRKALRLHL